MTSTIYLVLLLFSLTLSSCGGRHDATNTGSASFGLTFEQAPAPVAIKSAPSMAPADICSSYGIDSISGTVYNSSNTVIATGGPWACSAHTGTINNIPTGSNLRIKIKGTVSGSVVWQGEVTGVTIYAGQDTNVGSIPMTYSSAIAISPSSISATMSADSTVSFSVTVTDADGNPINGAKVYITGAFAVPRALPRYQFYSSIGGVNAVDSGFSGTTDANGVYSFSITVYTGATFTDSINVSSGSVSASMVLTFTQPG